MMQRFVVTTTLSDKYRSLKNDQDYPSGFLIIIWYNGPQNPILIIQAPIIVIVDPALADEASSDTSDLTQSQTKQLQSCRENPLLQWKAQLPLRNELDEESQKTDPRMVTITTIPTPTTTTPTPTPSAAAAAAAAAATTTTTTIIDRLRRPRYRGLRFI